MPLASIVTATVERRQSSLFQPATVAAEAQIIRYLKHD